MTAPNHPIQGGGYAMATGFPERRAGGRLSHASAATRRATPPAPLRRSEGIFAGFSSGANVAAALQLLAGEMAGKTIAVLICDSGLKYLSTDLWP